MEFLQVVVSLMAALLALILYALIQMRADRKTREEKKERYAAATVWKQIQGAFASEGKVLSIRHYGRHADTKDANGWPFSGTLEWGLGESRETREVEFRILPDPIPVVQARSRMNDNLHSLSSARKFYFPDEKRMLNDYLTGGDKK